MIRSPIFLAALLTAALAAGVIIVTDHETLTVAAY